MKKHSLKAVLIPLFLAFPLHGGSTTHNQDLDKQPDGLILSLPQGFLKVQLVSDSIVRVAFAKDKTFFRHNPISLVDPGPLFKDWTLDQEDQTLELHTIRLMVLIDRSTGAIEFLDPKGNPILSEAQDGRSMEKALVQGENVFHIRQQWVPNKEEALYGLGQHQYGILNWKGHDLDLWQRNTTAFVPLLVSSQGYGLLWNNTSFTRFGNLDDFSPIPPENLLDRSGKPGGLTSGPLKGSGPTSQTSEINVEVHPKRGDPKPGDRIWEGFLETPAGGDHQFEALSNGGIKVWLDNQLIMEHWRQGWLTDRDRAKVFLQAGRRIPLKIEWDTEQGTTLKFLWKTPRPSQNTSLWSEVGDGLDYTFLYGPSLDQVVAGYRRLTGQAPLMPSWAFGLWQSRQRYETAQQGLEAAQGFRKRGIPFDNLVQDWMYWPKDAWGSHQFDPQRFPDPEGWLKSLHALNTHVMLSVWGKFYPGSANFEEMRKGGYLYGSLLKEGVKDWLGQPYTFYDAFNQKARQLFWSQINRDLFKKGVDAWWMDSTEPDLMPSPPEREKVQEHMNPTALGSGARMLNGYPLQNSEGVYQGQRASAPNQRVFILTRCAFAGQQRTASALWSGDITSEWSVLAKQIPAGLNLSLSGIPYWTTDVGGYTMREKFHARNVKPEDEEEWRELNTRWFQYGTFCPLLRVHGEQRPREMWELGGGSSQAYKAELKFDRLRYRLFPYLYSTAWEVTNHGGLFLRPLAMDFPWDFGVQNLTDEYMFGRAFLAAPIVRYKARSRSVYLPEAGWYDFWTGKYIAPSPGAAPENILEEPPHFHYYPGTTLPIPSGKTIEAPAAYDSMPLFVKAGSIIPFGPELQYISEKPQDPMTFYIYTGADGDFTLYEDDGLTYGYEKGAYSEIPIHWEESTRKLTFGPRKGSFLGMLSERTFQVLLISQQRPVGFSFDPKVTARFKYEGKTLSLDLAGFKR